MFFIQIFFIIFGNKVKFFLSEYGHHVVEVDTLTDEYLSFDYCGYDALIHVAGIVHEAAKKAEPELFKRVNIDLPFEVAQKAKASGVKRFIFLSTMAVYGLEKELPEGKEISKGTPLNPKSLYGKSKLEAERLLETLSDDSFRLSIVRPPNVYGKGCKGNYINRFCKLAELPFFPMAFEDVKQSMLYIDNLSCIIKMIIETDSTGVFHPQDSFAPSTVDMILTISRALNGRTRFSPFLGKIVAAFKRLSLVKKMFGGVSYSKEFVYFENQYQIVDFTTGMAETVRGE